MYSYKCPKCRSPQVIELNLAMKTVGAVGAIGGVAYAVLTMPRQEIVPEGEDAFSRSLATGLAGGAAGARLGAFIDQHVLDNLECQSCGLRFSASLS